MSIKSEKIKDVKIQEKRTKAFGIGSSKLKTITVAGGGGPPGKGDIVVSSTGMIIEDAEKLRHWLTAILQPLCDADPAALAKYVLALIKKDKPEKELRQSMSDQLDVFLQQETKGFVDRLFQLLNNKKYLTESPPPIVPKEDPSQGTEVKMDLGDLTSSQESLNSTTNSSSSGTVLSSIGSSEGSSSIASSLLSESSAVAGTKDDGKIGKRDRKDDERDRNRRGRRSRSPARRGTARAGRSRSPRSDRIRDRRYHPRKMRHDRDPWDRRRSRSPLRNRSSSPTRNRSRTPPRYRRHSRSRSRSRSPGDIRGRSRSPTGNSLRDKGEKKEGLLPVPMNLDDRTTEGGLKDVGDKPSIQSVIVKAGAPNEKLDKGNRCRDFDEKGLCMRGELCPFDHGSDPVVLEDVVITNVTNAAGNVDYNRAMQAGGYGASAASVMRPSVATMGEYYPDNPAMDPSAGWGNPVFRPRGMAFDPILRGGRGGMMARGPLGMASAFPPQRELISVPVMGMQPNSPGDPHGQPPPMIGMHPHSGRGMFSGRGRGRGGFDHSRLGFKAARNYANCSLEVKKIPKDNNNIMDLNSHFQKFGKIVNIQIQFENDPEAALVTFNSPAESQAAYRSTEAVLNNRFIRVFWHNKEKENEESMEEGGPLRLSVRDRLGGHEGDDKQEQEKILVSGINLTKTVYNPALLAAKKTDAAAEKVQAVEAIKKSQEMLAAQETLKKQHEQQKKDALKLINDLRKRKQDMMSEQIEQQKKLISKLESGKGTMKPEEREQLMKLIKSLQDSIEKLKKDLDEGGAKALAAQPIPKSKEEAQREMLDAELELYNKEQEGGDTVALQNKILDLRAKTKSMGMPYRGRGAFRGAPRGFGSRGRGGRHQLRSLRTVDRRPTRVQVTGFPVSRLPEILPHFSQFGTITEYETDHQTPSMILNFESRKSAEVALANGKMFGDTPLVIEWVSNGNPDSASQISSNGDTSHPEIGNGATIEDDELGDILAHEILLTYEEEEDEEMEKDRSWRR